MSKETVMWSERTMADRLKHLIANRAGKAWIPGALIFSFLLLMPATASDGWVLFKGQANGPVKSPDGNDLSLFAHKKYPGLYWSELYYHQMTFSDGSVMTAQLGFNAREASVVMAFAKAGAEPFTDYWVMDFDDVKFDGRGFGFSFGGNRVRLDGKKYQLDLETGKVKAKLVFDILSPGVTFGDGMVRYPDGKSFAYYSFPIPWAKVRGRATIQGREYDLEGFGNMNHDIQSLSPLYLPANWQAFWFFGEDHALMIADFYVNKKFGELLTQRLVFVDREGGMFSSTNFPVKWDQWAELKGSGFPYPRHYNLSAEGGGARLEAEVNNCEVILSKDLFSNLPAALRPVARQITRNGWTVDCWSGYTLTYRQQGKISTYQGLGMVRWTNEEAE